MAKNRLLNAVKGQADKVAEDWRARRQAKQLQRKERELQQAKEEEERILAEQEAIKAEKERLMNMDQQELLAEAIMAIRGFYQQFSELQERQDYLEIKMANLEREIEEINNYDPSDYDDDDEDED